MDLKSLYEKACSAAENRACYPISEAEKRAVLSELARLAALPSAGREELDLFDMLYTTLFYCRAADAFDRRSIRNADVRALADEIRADFADH